MNFIIKHKITLILILTTAFLFAFLFRDVLFFGKTLRGEPFAAGVLPSGPVSYVGDTVIYRFLSDPGASSWADDPLFVTAANQIKSGNLPWWNPHIATGESLFASGESGITFPLKWPLIINSSPFMFDLFSLTLIGLGIVFTFLFLRRVGINRWIAMVFGFAFGSSGALIRYVNRIHLSNAALIPFSLFAVEYHIQRRTRLSFFVYFGSILLVISALFPEATVFALTLPAVYFLFRMMQQEKKLPLIKDFVLANILAFLIFSPLLISFLKLFTQSFTLHPTNSAVGLHGEQLSIVFSLVTHWVFKPDFTTALHIIQFGQIGWLGGSVLILGVLGLFTAGYKRNIGMFFAVYGVVSVLKTFGIWPFNLLGYLPVYKQLIFGLYNHPATTLSLVLSAAFFVNYLYEKGAKFKHLFLGVLIYLSVFGSFFLMSQKVWLSLVIHKVIFSLTINYFVTFLYFVVSTLISFFVLILLAALWKFKQRKIFVVILLVAISVEIFFNFPKAFPVRDIGYVPVKYLTEVKKNVGSDFRVSGKDSILYPQISGVYGLSDIRQLDALFFDDYFKFLKIIDPTIIDRFTTLNENWIIKNPEVLKMLAVKNVLSVTPIEETELSDISTFGIPIQEYTIAGIKRNVFYVHPPFSKEIVLDIPKGTNTVYFYLAMNPAVWDSGKGDGIKMHLATSQGVKSDTIVDPKNNPSDREWRKVEFPVFAGQVKVDLDLEGLKTTDYDWSGMSDFYSADFANNYGKYFVMSKGFPIAQGNYLVRSYDVIGANKIAYFPNQIRFVSEKDFETEFKNDLAIIDSTTVALDGSRSENTVSQKFNEQPVVNQKSNGDVEVTIPKNHPDYLFASLPFNKDLRASDQNGKSLTIYKSNIAFVLVKLNLNSSKVILSSLPSGSTKTLFSFLVSGGIILLLLRIVFHKRLTGKREN